MSTFRSQLILVTYSIYFPRAPSRAVRMARSVPSTLGRCSHTLALQICGQHRLAFDGPLWRRAACGPVALKNRFPSAMSLARSPVASQLRYAVTQSHVVAYNTLLFG